MLPFVVCLCPTFRRPSRLVENSIACFEQQTYPSTRRKLLILDDASDLEPQHGDNWEVVSKTTRYSTLPDKYHAMVALEPNADVYCIWEDDDIYLPWHVEVHAVTYINNSNGWSKPSDVFALTTGEMVRERATGRLHASLAFSRSAYDITGGWPRTPRADFDLQFISLLTRMIGQPNETINEKPPSYIFRWGSTQHPHGQNFMYDGPGDEKWYDRAGESLPLQPYSRRLEPKLDEETMWIYGNTSTNS